MHCYGYIKNTDSEKPSELEEVTMQAGPDTLRDMARFLLYAADQMELHGEKFGHEHFEDYCSRPGAECRFVVAGKKYG